MGAIRLSRLAASLEKQAVNAEAVSEADMANLKTAFERYCSDLGQAKIFPKLAVNAG